MARRFYPELKIMWFAPLVTLVISGFTTLFVGWFFAVIGDHMNGGPTRDYVVVFVVMGLMGLAALAGVFLSIRALRKYLRFLDSISDGTSHQPSLQPAQVSWTVTDSSVLSQLIVNGQTVSVFAMWGFWKWIGKKPQDELIPFEGHVSDYAEGMHLIESGKLRIWYRLNQA